MKKRARMLLLGLGLLILLLAAYFILKNSNKEEKGTGENAEKIAVTELDSSDMTGVSFLIGGEEKRFIKNGETWIMEGNENFPLDESKVNMVVNRSSALTAERKLEDVDDLSEYGLSQPSNCITMTMSDGTETKIFVGNKNSSTGNTYVYLNDQKEVVYIVSVDYNSILPDGLMQIAVGEEFPTITSSNIAQIDIQKSDDNIKIKKDSDSGEWMVSENDEKESTADSQAVSTLQSTIAGLQFKELVDYTGENMEPYGLNQPAAAVTVKYTENVEDSEQGTADSTAVSKESSEDDGSTVVDKELILYVGEKDESGDYYVRVDGSNEVHTMSSDSIDEILKKTAADYWNLSIGSIPVNSLSGLTVTYQGITSEIKRNTVEDTDEEGNNTTTVTYTCSEKEVNKTDFETFYNKLTAIEAQSKEQGLSSSEEPEMEVVFHTEQGDKKISFTLYDENFYLAQDTEERLGLVGKTSLNELFRSYENLKLS